MLLPLIAVCGCSNYYSEFVACGDAHVSTVADADAVKSAITDLVTQRGFIRASDPGGGASSSGLRTQGEAVRWYLASDSKRPFLWLRISQYSRPTGGADFNLVLRWSFKGSDAERDRIKTIVQKRVSEFSEGLEGIRASVLKRSLTEQPTRPNKSLQPTPTAVMPPAAQEIMPTMGVAEH
jgi:hypothetical protein